MKTVTYDPAVYKLVPVEPSNEMAIAGISAHFDSPQQINGLNYYRDMLAAVPDQLPRVVEHSGEPVAYRWRWTGKPCDINPWQVSMTKPRPAFEKDTEYAPLFTHPAPSQLDPFEAVYCQLKGCEPHGLASCDDFKDWKASLSAPSQPSAEALVQAALEAAAITGGRTAELCLNFPDGQRVADAIRALSAQQIIESCKGEKS